MFDFIYFFWPICGQFSYQTVQMVTVVRYINITHVCTSVSPKLHIPYGIFLYDEAETRCIHNCDLSQGLNSFPRILHITHACILSRNVIWTDNLSHTAFFFFLMIITSLRRISLLCEIPTGPTETAAVEMQEICEFRKLLHHLNAKISLPVACLALLNLSYTFSSVAHLFQDMNSCPIRVFSYTVANVLLWLVISLTPFFQVSIHTDADARHDPNAKALMHSARYTVIQNSNFRMHRLVTVKLKSVPFENHSTLHGLLFENQLIKLFAKNSLFKHRLPNPFQPMCRAMSTSGF